MRRRGPRVTHAAEPELEKPPAKGRSVIRPYIEVDVAGRAGRDRRRFLASPERERHSLQQDAPGADRAETGPDLPQHLPLDQLPDPLAHRRCPQGSP